MLDQSQISAEIQRLRRRVYAEVVAALDELDAADHPGPTPLPLYVAIAIGSGDWQRALDAFAQFARRVSRDVALASIRAAGLRLPVITPKDAEP